jgi:hypothetical protein
MRARHRLVCRLLLCLLGTAFLLFGFLGTLLGTRFSGIIVRALFLHKAHMTDLMDKAIASVRSWPARQQDEAAEILLALDRLGADAYVASDDELRAIDEALAQVEAGEYATDAEIEAAYSRFRK